MVLAPKTEIFYTKNMLNYLQFTIRKWGWHSKPGFNKHIFRVTFGDH